VIGNPAGGNKYEHGQENTILNEGLLNLTSKKHVFSEYELSIQQAVRSVKVGGKICLILPEGFFSNSQDEFLRKYVAKYCKVLAIISLPRGVFKKGTSTKQQQKGAQTSTQKMSILYLEKLKDIDKANPVKNLDFDNLE
jgi:type I restriction-modification system DNA methylase subunit